MRGPSETPARPRLPARAQRAGRARRRAAVLGPGAGVGHAAARRVIAGDDRGWRADPEPTSPPPHRLAAGRAGCRGRARRRSCSGLGSACGGGGLAPRPTGGVRRDRELVADGAARRRRAAPLPDRTSARTAMVARARVERRRGAGRRARLGAQPGRRQRVRRRAQPVRRRPAADRRDVRRRVRDHGGVAAPRAGCGRAPVPCLHRRRATAAEVVRPRQRGPRRGAAGRGRVVVGRTGGARHPGSGGHALADRHLCRDPALPALRRRPGHQPDLQLRHA